MRQFIISVNNDTELFHVTWRFAVLFCISFTTTFIHYILIIVQVDSTDKVEPEWIFYLRLYLWILDVFTNAVCTVLTYNGFEKGYEMLCGKCCAYKTGCCCYCARENAKDVSKKGDDQYIKCGYCCSKSHKLAHQAKKYIPDNSSNQINSHEQISGKCERSVSLHVCPLSEKTDLLKCHVLYFLRVYKQSHRIFIFYISFGFANNQIIRQCNHILSFEDLFLVYFESRFATTYLVVYLLK